MDKVSELLINLLAAAIGFTIAWLRTKIQRLVRRRRARRFWRPFVDSDLKLVLAVFNDARHVEWERSGVAGVGDVIALSEIESQLRRIKFAEYGIVYAHHLEGTEFGANMVLIGGADSNRVTRKVMERLPLTLVYMDPDNNDVAFHDRISGEVLRPVSASDGELLVDQGVVIRAHNPFARDRKVLVIAGSYGHGSAAAARLVASNEFMKNPLVAGGKDFELFFTTDIIENVPQKAVVRRIRELVTVDRT